MTDYVGWRRRRRDGAEGNARSIVCRWRDKSLTTVAERLGAQPSATARPARAHVPEAVRRRVCNSVRRHYAYTPYYVHAEGRGRTEEIFGDFRCAAAPAKGAKKRRKKTGTRNKTETADGRAQRRMVVVVIVVMITIIIILMVKKTSVGRGRRPRLDEVRRRRALLGVSVARARQPV